MAKLVKRVPFYDEQIFLLIELYRENSCLWDIKSPEYKNANKRKTALANIAEKMRLSEEIIKKKLTSIRATYLLEKKKIGDSSHTGASTDDLYRPTVPWFDHMVFLNDVIICRKTISNFTQDEGEVGQESQENIEASPIHAIPEDETAKCIEPPLRVRETSSKTQQLRKKRKINNGDTSTEKSIDAAIEKLCKVGEQDIFDNFGNLIASQLKSIPMEDALKLQMEINQIVTNRLIAIHRAVSSNPLSSNQVCFLESLRPSTSFTNYSGYIFENTHPCTPYQNESQTEETSNSFETEDFVYRAP